MGSALNSSVRLALLSIDVSIVRRLIEKTTANLISKPTSIASVPFSILTTAILLTPFFFHCTLLGAKFRVVDPHHIDADADPDPGYQNDPDPQQWQKY
jgi:hypothetical protein